MSLSIDALMKKIDESLRTHIKTVFCSDDELRKLATDLKNFFEAPEPAPTPPAPATTDSEAAAKQEEPAPPPTPSFP